MDLLSLVVTIGLAVLTGLCYLAVKHPKTFQSLWGKLYGAAIVTAMVLATWGFGVGTTHTRLLPFITAGKAEEALAQVMPIYIRPSYVALGLFAVCGFLLFLSWLSDSIKKERDEGSKGG